MRTQTHFLLRLYTDEAALLGDQSVVHLLMDRARQAGLLGATVHRAQSGFGHGAHLHRGGLVDRNSPIIVEIVDVEPKVRDFWDDIADLHGIGLATLEKVEVLRGAREQE